MTRADKPVTRLTYTRHQGRELVVTLSPTFLVIREKGRRVGYSIDYAAVYHAAAKIAARQARADKLAARAKKGAR